MIPIYKPYIEKYKKSAIEAINSTWISNFGKFINYSTELIKKKFGVSYCILMNNGTSATHCLFLALKYKYPSIKKIYVPNNVFIAAINTSLMVYNIEDLEVMKLNEKTLNIDTSEEYIKSLDKNACVLIVHNLGNIVNVERLKRIRNDLIFIEDNCEGIFGKYENIYSGTSKGTLCSSLSFYANKTITTGEGGAFLTNDYEIYKFINSTHSHGMTEEKYIHDKIAYNYRMTNIQAAILYEQLIDLDNILEMKHKIFLNYDTLLSELFKSNKIQKLDIEDNTESSRWMYCILINNLEYKKIEKYMKNNLIEIRPFFYDLRKHEHLKEINIKYTESKNYEKGIMLPSYPQLNLKDQKKIYNCLKEYINIYINEKA